MRPSLYTFFVKPPQIYSDKWMKKQKSPQDASSQGKFPSVLKRPLKGLCHERIIEIRENIRFPPSFARRNSFRLFSAAEEPFRVGSRNPGSHDSK
jgi:hypothetical protein